MIAARQEIELRPQLERLDRLLLASAGVAPGALAFTFRPLWQMDAAAQAAIALQKAQTTQIYAGLNLWPTEVMAGLVRGQLAEDGIYPNAGTVFAATERAAQSTVDQVVNTHPNAVQDYSPDQQRDPEGRWTSRGGSVAVERQPSSIAPTASGETEPQTFSHATTGPTAQSTLLQKIGNVLNALNPIGSAQAAGTKNLLSADPNAEAPHSTFRRAPDGSIQNYETYEKNEHTGGYDPALRYRGNGGPHKSVQPPFALEREPGKGPGSTPSVPRPALPHEVPESAVPGPTPSIIDEIPPIEIPEIFIP